MAAFVLFKAADQTWALPASAVAQVLRMAKPAPSPGAAPHVQGVLNVHGVLVPVVDARVRLGAPARAPGATAGRSPTTSSRTVRRMARP